MFSQFLKASFYDIWKHVHSKFDQNDSEWFKMAEIVPKGSKTFWMVQNGS